MTERYSACVLVRGAGDLASGVALRLYRSGVRLVMTELPAPLVVRRSVSFADAVFNGICMVEDVVARRVVSVEAIEQAFETGKIPVIIDPDAHIRHKIQPVALVDARMLKTSPEIGREAAPLVIGLGPGFIPGENCHAAIETRRGHTLGRVLWQGSPEPDTGIPGGVTLGELTYRQERLLRATAGGAVNPLVDIGDHVIEGQVVAYVGETPVLAGIQGIVRGMVYPGLTVSQGTKIGDIDPRSDPRLCDLASEKALAIGGGVLEALLSRADIRKLLYG